MGPVSLAAVAPIAAFAAIGLVAGGVRRGRLGWMVKNRPRLWGLAAAALAATAVGDAFGAGVSGFEVAGITAPAVLALIGMGAGLAFVASNLAMGGMAVVGVGIAANLAALVANRATPVRAGALVEARIVDPADVDRAVLGGPREIADSGTVLEILGDVIPVPELGLVVSFGDLIVLVGLAAVISNLMRHRPAGVLPRSAEQALAALSWAPSPAPAAEPALTMSPNPSQSPTVEPALAMTPSQPSSAEPVRGLFEG